MKRQLQAGLVVEGNSTKSAILRLPKLAEEIGPIKSTVLRVARRVSNFLKAGYAVSEYAELQEARPILIRVPDESVPRVVEEICATELQLEDLAFILCETWLMSDVLKPLSDRGASVATLVSVTGSRRDWFVVEGQLSALRQIKRLLEMSDARAIELRSGAKQFYFAASLLSTAIPMPLFLTAQQSLRAAGISGNHLYTLADDLAQGMMRDLAKGGRPTWGGPLTECSEETANSHLAALRLSDPAIAEVLDEQLAWARAAISRQKIGPRETP
jgi:hypothetical protein